MKNSAVTANDVQRQNDIVTQLLNLRSTFFHSQQIEESEEAKKLTSMVPTATPTMEPEVNAKCEKASQENMPQAKDVAIEDDKKDDLEDVTKSSRFPLPKINSNFVKTQGASKTDLSFTEYYQGCALPLNFCCSEKV